MNRKLTGTHCDLALVFKFYSMANKRIPADQIDGRMDGCIHGVMGIFNINLS